ncbi:hypothetical protein [Nocardiopsis sp. JB363]|uniref:hypothetical protein n=1 Tax=Nocardiopsis sp. JB363 TaxID=1434837 RepID=UPI00135778AB|nr:hypothetical protein [Nocardiopsis sp. JB363]
MTAHSAVLCALLLCFPPPPNDGVTPCPSTAPATTLAMEPPESPPTQAPPQATDPPKAPDVDTGTGALGPLPDCVAALETAETEGSGGGDTEERERAGEEPGGTRGENTAPSATAPSGGGGEDGGTAGPSPEAGPDSGVDPEEGTEDEEDEEDTGEESEGADAPDPGAAEDPGPVATGIEHDAESAPEPEPEPSPLGEDSGAPTESTLSSPTPEPRPTENGTVSRASATTRPITPAPKPTPIGDSPDVGDRPPSKKVEETEPVDGFAFEETSATSPFGRALGVTSTTVLFLLGVATLGLRLAVGWPRFPPLYLGRRRLGGDLDTR